MTNWFDVDKQGLAKLLEKRGKAFAVFELIQNAWDSKAKTVLVDLHPVDGRAAASLVVSDDDPNGFADLSHAFTLFAESVKKGDPEKRGRFNLGEKLVLALCESAEIASTKGTIRFDREGRHRSHAKTECGSRFQALIRMTRAELADVERQVRRLIPPDGVTTHFNGELLRGRQPVATTRAQLPTEVADADGFLRPTARETDVRVYDAEGEPGWLYEMGIPVVELGGGERWNVEIAQKIPLNTDRDNVTPSYLRKVRTLLAEAVAGLLNEGDAKAPWTAHALEDPKVSPAAVEAVLDRRFGKKRAIWDPSDPEANKQLQNEGYTIIAGGALSGKQWDNVRRHGLAEPAGQIRPSAFTYGDGPLERVVTPEKYTPGMARIAAYAQELAQKLIDESVRVKVVNEPVAIPHLALFSADTCTLTLNVGRLGWAWFGRGDFAEVHELLLHELAHAKVKDHLTREFMDEVTRLAVKLAWLAFEEPGWLRNRGW